MSEKVAVIGLGYVGLPLALGFARVFPDVIGFDVNQQKVLELQSGHDRTGETDKELLLQTKLKFSSNPADIKGRDFLIVAVPTPVDSQKRPDLTPLIKATEFIGKVLTPGAVVVYESTVYPGVTEEICGPVLERVSGLKRGTGFKLGYSPERVNPGDKERTLEKIVKVVAGEDNETLERVAALYGAVVQAGIFKAASIKVAEAAKVIENTQRDLNIALMNELALIFERMNIRTSDVLAAARTKWNFLPFTPGLVGGHCIGVDPYYLTAKAEELGYHPQVILAGRRINDGMGSHIGQTLAKLLAKAGKPITGARVGILGLTFKENVCDLRNSRVPDIITEAQSFGIQVLVHDPLAHEKEALEEYGITLNCWESLTNLDAIILAVPHREYLGMALPALFAGLLPGGVIMDIKSSLDPKRLPPQSIYWSL